MDDATVRMIEDAFEAARAASNASISEAQLALDTALGFIEDARRAPAAHDAIASEAMDCAYRRATEALGWLEHAQRRVQAAR